MGDIFYLQTTPVVIFIDLLNSQTVNEVLITRLRCAEPGWKGVAGMTKAELVEIIAQETGVNKKDTGLIVNLIMDNIGQALVDGNKVELRGFGSFKVKTRRARLARNPRTGDSVDVPAKRVPFFKASNDLKGRLNK